MNILVPLAEGFEEIEAVTIIDVLRRASLNVTSASLGDLNVTGSHGITVQADARLADLDAGGYGWIVLPGGMPGSDNLRKSERVLSLIRDIHGRGHAAALCAAPIVLARAGILKGRRATCFPGFEEDLAGAHIVNEPVVTDGNIVTARGPGCAIPFALEITGIIRGPKVRETLKSGMQVYWMPAERV